MADFLPCGGKQAVIALLFKLSSQIEVNSQEVGIKVPYYLILTFLQGIAKLIKECAWRSLSRLRRFGLLAYPCTELFSGK